MSLCRKAPHSPVLTMCVCVVFGRSEDVRIQRENKGTDKSRPITKVKCFQNPKINRSHLVFVILFGNKSNIYLVLSLFQPSQLLIPILDQAPMYQVFSICNLVHVTLTFFFPLTSLSFTCSLQFCILDLYLHLFKSVTRELSPTKTSEDSSLQPAPPFPF